ncbi:hypothetical protein ACEWFW_07910 [Bifidobacterium catenulatum subsp. kashiwanohense]|uniref:hypothetical protein n=1 Tax=Bifidobacterium catenulatum TaxID=1686 RepID=UPI003CFC3DDE
MVPLISLEILGVFDIRTQVSDEFGLDYFFGLTAARTDDHNVAQIARSRAGIEQRVAAACDVRSHDIELDVELILDDLGEPALPLALIVRQLVEHLDRHQRIVIGIACGVTAAGRHRACHGKHATRRDEFSSDTTHLPSLCPFVAIVTSMQTSTIMTIPS